MKDGNTYTIGHNFLKYQEGSASTSPICRFVYNNLRIYVLMGYGDWLHQNNKVMIHRYGYGCSVLASFWAIF